MTNTTQTTTTQAIATAERFLAGKVARNADVDVILADLREGKIDLPTIIDEAMDHNDPVYVVDSSMKKAKEAAAALNELYVAEYVKAQQAQSQLLKSIVNKEEKKEEAKGMNNPKEMVDGTFEEKKGILNMKQAQEFMDKHSAPLKNAQTAPVNKNKLEEEAKMTATNTNVTMGNTAPAKQEEEKAMTNTNTEVKGQEEKVAPSRRRLSTDNEEVAQGAIGGTRRVLSEGRLERTDSIRSQFVKHEGPWYLNADLYPVLARFEAILNTMSDAEMGIQNIVLVDPSQLKRYDRKKDVYVVIQVMSNGVVLEFPIKQSKSETSKSDLSSTSIGWVPMKNGMRPAFGFYRSNFPVVTATCTCGKKMENVSASNLYCFECKTRHNDAAVSITHATLGLGVEEFTFQTIPNMEVPKDILALVMAIAQYDAGFPMHGIIAE